MALVVFLKGVNVGGHRRVRPSEFARAMADLDVVNVGAAGTLIVRGARRHAPVRSALNRLLPFEAEAMICEGDEIVDLVASEPFKGRRARTDVIQFAGILPNGRRPKQEPPLTIPASGAWVVKALERRGRYVIGVHKRQMKAIGCLQALERQLGSTLTVRGWSTMTAVAKLLA